MFENKHFFITDGSKLELKNILHILIVFEDSKCENLAAKLFLFEEGRKMLIGSDILTKGKLNVNFQKLRLESPRTKIRSAKCLNLVCLRLNR